MICPVLIINTGTFPYGHLNNTDIYTTASSHNSRETRIYSKDCLHDIYWHKHSAVPFGARIKEVDCVMFLDISEDEDYLESNKMHGINGYLYANLPGLELCLGDRVSWHLIGLGNEVDMHTAYFYGNTFTYNGNMKDTVSLLPGNIDKT